MTVNDIRIRFAKSEDAPALCAIYEKYVKETAITFETVTPSVEEFKERIEKTLRNYPYLVAEVEDKIVGYAYAGVFKDRAAYIYTVEVSIYVEIDMKGNGIGAALYKKLEEVLRMQGITDIYACIAIGAEDDPYLDVSSPNFHEHLGFTLCGTFPSCGHKFGRWYGVVWMGKNIAPHVKDPKNFIPLSDPELRSTAESVILI